MINNHDLPEPTPKTVNSTAAAAIATTPVRRVGVITLGICLMATGLLLLCALLIPNFNYAIIARFAPVVFIALGAEVLYGYFTSKNGPIKYDFFSGLICLILSLGCIGLSFVPSLMQYFGPERNIAEAQAQTALYDEYYSTLNDISYIEELSINVNLEPRTYPTPFTLADLVASDYTQTDILIYGDFETSEAFAAAAEPILQKLSAAGLPSQNIQVYSRSEKYSFHVNVYDQFSLNLTGQALVNRVESNYMPDPVEELSEYNEIDAATE